MHVDGLLTRALMLAGVVSGKPYGHSLQQLTTFASAASTTSFSVALPNSSQDTYPGLSTSSSTGSKSSNTTNSSSAVTSTTSNEPIIILRGAPGPPGGPEAPDGPGDPGGNPLEELTQKAMENLRAKEKLNPHRSVKCSLANAHKRKDWEKMTQPERKNYLEAVQCMFTKPSTVSASWAAGARVRYDDFAAIHINKTLGIHGTGNFLTWHRYHNWLYEKALREDCGYRGAQPYWNWFKYQNRLLQNPLFDGSELSMGGQGTYFEHNGTFAAGLVFVPSGTGGGCVQGGFIEDIKISLGPIRPAMRGMSEPVAGTGVYNPRCLRRDLNEYAAKKWHTYENLLDIVTGEHSGDIVAFQDEFQGRPPDGFLGLHSGGHHVIGGDNSDNYSSVVDPIFHFHHSMVDYVYWLWQALHPEQAYTVGGTIKARSTELGFTQRTDILDLGEVGPGLTIEETLDTLAGPYCYIYE